MMPPGSVSHCVPTPLAICIIGICFSVGGALLYPFGPIHGGDEQYLGRTTLETSTLPHWIPESISAGSTQLQCGTVQDEARLPDCTSENIAAFGNLSRVFSTDPGDISRDIGNVVLLGENANMNLASCVVPGSDAPERSHRLVVQTQWTNSPRCCNADEADGLIDLADGERSSWTDASYLSMENNTAYGLRYYRIQPKVVSCSRETPCPLVVQLGTANSRRMWFLVQAKCEVCAKLLGAVLVSPIVPKTRDNLDAMSNERLLTLFFPWVESYLQEHTELDLNRVYLVALSQACDAALRAALLRPDVFSLVSLAGKFDVGNEARDMMLDIRDGVAPDRLSTGRLSSIVFSVGDDDSVMTDEEFYQGLGTMLRTFNETKQLRVDLHVYPDARHTIWWAAWNSMHDVLWSGKRVPFLIRQLPSTCRGGRR